MKTDLNITINSIESAQKYLQSLKANDELYHPDDNAHDIVWDTAKPTKKEREKLNINMDKVRDFIPDPCGYLLELEGHILTDSFTLCGKEFKHESTGGGCTAYIHRYEVDNNTQIQFMITDGDANAPFSINIPCVFNIDVWNGEGSETVLSITGKTMAQINETVKLFY